MSVSDRASGAARAAFFMALGAGLVLLGQATARSGPIAAGAPRVLTPAFAGGVASTDNPIFPVYTTTEDGATLYIWEPKRRRLEVHRASGETVEVKVLKGPEPETEGKDGEKGGEGGKDGEKKD